MDVIGLFKELFRWAVPVLDNVPIIRMIIGIALVFFAPGFVWTLVLFRQITHLERLVLSFALSLALVTLSIFGLNIVINMQINGLNTLLTILLLIIIPLIICFIQRCIHKEKTHQTKEK